MSRILRFISNLKIRTKLLLGYVTAFIFLLIVVSLIVYPIMQRAIEANVESELSNTTKTILGMIKTSADASIKNYLRAIAEKNRDIVSHYFLQYQKGILTESQAKEEAGKALLSQTIGKTGYIFVWNVKKAPESIPLAVHPKIQGEDVAYVDFVQKGAQIKNGYMEYSWKNPGEEKAREKAMYLSYFKPWNWVIAASSYREEFMDLINVDYLRDSILSIRFGKTGYPYIMDSRGNIIIHPALNGNVYDVRDSSGRQFIQEMCKEKNGKIIYTWRNPDEKEFRKKLVVFNYIPEFDWIVASSSYLEEFYEPLHYIRGIIVAIFLVSLAFLSLLTLVYSTYIVKNVNRLIHSFRTGSSGDLTVRITETSKDEFGSLAEYFNNFMEKLNESNQLLHREINEHRRSEANYRSVIENIQDVFYRSDIQGNLVMASPSFLTLLGYESLDDCLGRPIDEAYYYNPGKSAEFIRQIKDTGSVANYELILKRRDGTSVTVETNSHFYFDDNGNVAGIEGTLRDITERKRAEEDRGKLESQLIQAQKMEAIGTLAGGIAHDFNNILSGIMGYSELSLKAVQDQPKVRQNMEQVLKAAERAKELVQQILAFSRKAAQEKKPVALSAVTGEVVRFMRASLPTTIEINPRIEDTADVILADPTQMHQVLMNICTNAGQAMKEKGGVLEIGLKEVVMDAGNLIHHPALKYGRYLELSVRDTGQGIPPKNIARIFEPYFTTKEKGEGTGLGLAVVHGIVKDHGGEITVYSEVGKGTIFRVYLPVMEKQVEGKNEEEEVVPRGKGETILFVDDEEMIVAVNKQLLEMLGYKVFAATDPLLAIEIFKENIEAIDLVITDKTMPHMTGFDFIRETRSLRADLPVIICSGFQEKEDMEKLADLRIGQLITKPVKMNVLAEAIREVLEKRIN